MDAMSTTNALCLVISCLVTSEVYTEVLSGSNQQGCSTCGMLQEASRNGSFPAIYHPPHFGDPPWRPATEWWVVSNRIERTTFLPVLNGRTNRFEQLKLLSSTTNWTHKVESVVSGRLPGAKE